MEVFARILAFVCSLLMVISEINFNALAQTTEVIRYYPTTCKLTREGFEFAGPLNRTVNNRTCQTWNSHEPHYNYYTNEHKEYPEGNSTAAGNKCRNPGIHLTEGVWCYTTDPNKRWEYCDVKLCECKVYSDPKGIKYQGQFSTTVSGKTCQRWTSRFPNIHPYYNRPAFFPDQIVSDAKNYCRNPNSSRDGPWCYTTDRKVSWEYCFVPICDFSVPMTPIMTEEPTTYPPSDTSTVRPIGTTAPRVQTEVTELQSTPSSMIIWTLSQSPGYSDFSITMAPGETATHPLSTTPTTYNIDTPGSTNPEIWTSTSAPTLSGHTDVLWNSSTPAEFSLPVTTEETATPIPSRTPTPVLSTTTPKSTKPQDWTDPFPSPLSRIIRNLHTASEQGSNIGALLSALNSTLSVILIIALIVFLVILIHIRNSITKVANSVTAETGADVASPPGPSRAKPAGLFNPKNSNVIGPAVEK